MNPEPRVSVVFVALGGQTPQSLLESAEHAGRFGTNQDLFLVTDNPQRWRERFPGTVVPYLKRHRNPIILEIENRFPRRAISGDGYWIKTIERLFALSALKGFVQSDAPIIHLESDVLSFVSDAIASALLNRCSRVAVPLVSENVGCASLFFAPDFPSLLKSLEVFRRILDQAEVWMSDMDVLGAAASSGEIDVLPTRPEEAWLNIPNLPAGRGVLFDAAAVGMYLFGPDSYHDSGFTMSGFQHPDYEHSLEDWRWYLENRSVGTGSNTSHVIATIHGKEYEFANLHLHSKRFLGECGPDNRLWQDVIAEANGLVSRVRRPVPVGYSPRIRLSVAVLGLALRIIYARLGRKA